ncbi:DUF3800 domain-containing protein [Desulfurivibrio alkaliphilus]|uniref:DUF3800 domain-containing protein n=1 Tax=Desulfurivibrio alkaliphilus (strain DSM 19089 / UNIQEM U267 / AHT2) TaxID=589865 RepID=D6Z581_DESAT|nr:DUF3800 domain-containing protein [Desulfurivibrio alkaliphilus]ADH84738.1 conserved hypothetical protein [Desulfurivibrio alkaliphilus AHT 2]
MSEQQGHTEYIAFLDECGDHSLTKIDRDFPIFVLSLLLVKRTDYRDVILPTINALKLKYWDHEGVSLHSRDIRKSTGPFAILQNSSLRRPFMEDLSALMRDLPYEVFIVGIHKQKLRDRYVRAENPYELALTFAMERLLYCLEQREQSILPIIAEARGTNEDNALKAAFFDLISNGTRYIGKGRFERMVFPLRFHNKRKNIAGIQLADLCAHPAARHILKPEQPNQAFAIVRNHLYGGNGKVNGWKVFP